MSTKEIVQDLLQRVPENLSLHNIAQEIEFVAAIRQGTDEFDRGEATPIDHRLRNPPGSKFVANGR